MSHLHIIWRFFCLHAVLFLSIPASAADYFFRPVDMASFQSWSSTLQFKLINPSDRPVVLKVSVKESGILLAEISDKPVQLTAVPASLLVPPGSSKLVTLKYQDFGRDLAEENYEIIVEQMPIWFGKPGSSKAPELMRVTRYISDVKVKSPNNSETFFAESISRSDSVELAQIKK